MRKLNIAIVFDGVSTTMAGSFISAKRFAEKLKNKGHNIIFITSEHPSNKERAFPDIKEYKSFSILLPKSEGQLYLSFPRVSNLKKIFQEEKIDIVHIMIPVPSAFQAVKAAKKLNIKVISHSHTQPENLFLHAPKFFPIKFLNYIFYKYMLALYKKTELTICPSKFSERALKAHNKKLKTTVMSNGANFEKFKKINYDKFLNKFNLSKDKKHILFVGRLHPEKKVDTLIGAMSLILKKYPKAHLLIIGFGHMQEGLEKFSKNIGLEKNITFCGRVSDEELVMAYSFSDIFVLPSLAELEGMAVLESMACENAIVVANSKESASVDFVNGNGFLFKSLDKKDLATKVLILLEDEKLRKKMALRSLEESKKYDIDTSIDKLERIYYKFSKK